MLGENWHQAANFLFAQRKRQPSQSFEKMVRPLMHAYPLSYGAIAGYMSSNKELDHDASDTGRFVA